jgi:hypothetical protein
MASPNRHRPANSSSSLVLWRRCDRRRWVVADARAAGRSPPRRRDRSRAFRPLARVLSDRAQLARPGDRGGDRWQRTHQGLAGEDVVDQLPAAAELTGKPQGSGTRSARFHIRCPSPWSGRSNPAVSSSDPGGPCSSCVVAASGPSLRSPASSTGRVAPSPCRTWARPARRVTASAARSPSA